MDDRKRDDISDRIHEARDDQASDEPTGEEGDLQGTPAGKRGSGIRHTAGDE